MTPGMEKFITQQVKTVHHRRLDELPLSGTLADRIVDEAKAPFEMTMNLFQKLKEIIVKSIGQVLFHTLTNCHTHASTDIVHVDELGVWTAL